MTVPLCIFSITILSGVVKPSDKGGSFILSKTLVEFNCVQLNCEQIVNKFEWSATFFRRAVCIFIYGYISDCGASASARGTPRALHQDRQKFASHGVHLFSSKNVTDLIFVTRMVTRKVLKSPVISRFFAFCVTVTRWAGNGQNVGKIVQGGGIGHSDLGFHDNNLLFLA